MGLSEEDAARIKEEERLKLQARVEFERDYADERAKKQAEREHAFFATLRDGVTDGQCPNCRAELRSRWLYCIACGVQVHRSCLWCHVPLPDREDLVYCPQCGKQT